MKFNTLRGKHSDSNYKSDDYINLYVELHS